MFSTWCFLRVPRLPPVSAVSRLRVNDCLFLCVSPTTQLVTCTWILPCGSWDSLITIRSTEHVWRALRDFSYRRVAPWWLIGEKILKDFGHFRKWLQGKKISSSFHIMPMCVPRLFYYPVPLAHIKFPAVCVAEFEIFRAKKHILLLS